VIADPSLGNAKLGRYFGDGKQWFVVSGHSLSSNISICCGASGKGLVFGALLFFGFASGEMNFSQGQKVFPSADSAQDDELHV
jgi:hypothetical protein